MSRLNMTKVAAPYAPSADTAEVYLDTTTELFKSIDDTGALRTFGQDGRHNMTADSGAINNTETIIVGGLNNARIGANQCKVGTMIKGILHGTCTSSVANASTWRFRIGTAGTTADGVLVSAANSVVAASGTNIPFVLELCFTVRAIGAAATVSGWMELRNTGVTGISAVTVQTVSTTNTAFDSTVANWLSLTYVAAAATTTCTFRNGVIQVLKI